MTRPKATPNFIADIHPGTLFFMLVTIVACVFALMPNIYLRFLLVPIFFILAILGNKGKEFAVSMKKIFFLCFVVFIIQGISFGTEVLFEIGFFKFKDLGVQRSFYFMLLFSSFGGLIILYFALINLYDLCTVMCKSGIPYTGTYIFLLTLQTIPLLGKKSKTIMEAQNARGIEVEGNLSTRIKAYIPMFGPLLLSSIFATEERALTLESRGFTSKCNKTHLYDVIKSKSDKTIDYVCVVVLVSILIYKGVSLWIV